MGCLWRKVWVEWDVSNVLLSGMTCLRRDVTLTGIRYLWHGVFFLVDWDVSVVCLELSISYVSLSRIRCVWCDICWSGMRCLKCDTSLSGMRRLWRLARLDVQWHRLERLYDVSRCNCLWRLTLACWVEALVSDVYSVLVLSGSTRLWRL